FSHCLKTACRIQSLVQDLEGIASSDDHAGRQVHGVMQALDGGHGFALKNEGIAHGLHGKHPDVLFLQNRKHSGLKAVVMVVHHVKRHLYGIKCELMSGCGSQHLQMNIRALVTSKSDVPDFPGFSGFQHSLQSASGSEDAVGVVVANDLMKLQQIDPVSLQT